MTECPKCKSNSHTLGVGTITCMSCLPFTDENGIYHHHDNNKVIQNYRCKNCDNEWCERIPNTCHCGWIQEIK